MTEVKQDIQKSIRVIKGCPCLKVFGDETLCVNNDEVFEVNVIEIDPSIFAFHTNKKSIESEQADEENVCYAAIYLNYPDNKVYCVSQGWRLRIHGKDVPVSDLEDAIQFMSTKDLSASAEVCSECLYKFLLTLADTFADTMTRQEKTKEVKRYVDKFSLMIAIKLSESDNMMRPIGKDKDIDESVDHFAFLREYLVQLLEQQTHWMKLGSELEKEEAEKWLIELVHNREKLARFEFQFYSQTLQLRDVEDFNLLIKMLSYILRTADQILQINNKIHEEIRTQRFAEIAKRDTRLEPLAAYAQKSRLVEHNFENILQILTRI